MARSVAGWETLATVWIRGLKYGGIIYYERLRYETEKELVRVMRMLGMKNVNRERLQCVLKHSDNNSFKRDPKKIIRYMVSHSLVAFSNRQFRCELLYIVRP